LRYVILGNGAAGVTAAAKLLELITDEDDITVISSENTPVYSKPMLPDYIGGKFNKEKLFLKDSGYYKQNNITFIAGNKAEKVDTVTKSVMLADQSSMKYDKLLICTGGIPFIPPIEGLEDVEYLILNSIADADKIKDYAASGGKAVVIGAGLTGVEVGFALKRLGMEVSIIEREDRVLPMLMDQCSSKVMEEELKKEKIELLLGKTVSKINRKNGKKVVLSNNEEVEFDMLVLTIGTRPNIECIRDSDIEVNRGIVVNEYMETSVKDVYAAGDVAELKDKISTGFVSTYVWPNAMSQGKCAAYCMTGITQEFSRLSAMQNTVQLRDIPFMSMGMANPENREFEILTHHDRDNRVYKRLILKDNVIKGMLLIGDIGTARTIAELIRKETDVSDFKDRLLDKDFRV
jgi:nitrite reductase (NADH) large subunit